MSTEIIVTENSISNNTLLKICNDCKHSKSLNEFPKSLVEWNGYNVICKKCFIIKRNEKELHNKLKRNYKLETDPYKANIIYKTIITLENKITIENNSYKKKYRLNRYKILERNNLYIKKARKIKSIDIKVEIARQYVSWFIKPKILKRDKHKCILCSLENIKFEVHHIIPVSMNKKLVKEETNLVTLCKDCHKKAHGTSFRDIDYIITEQLKQYIRIIYAKP